MHSQLVGFNISLLYLSFFAENRLNRTIHSIRYLIKGFKKYSITKKELQFKTFKIKTLNFHYSIQ